VATFGNFRLRALNPMVYSPAMKTNKRNERATKATELRIDFIEQVESRFPFKLNWADYIRRLIEKDNREIMENETHTS
jgi:hypothetical protein